MDLRNLLCPLPLVLCVYYSAKLILIIIDFYPRKNNFSFIISDTEILHSFVSQLSKINFSFLKKKINYSDINKIHNYFFNYRSSDLNCQPPKK